MSHFPAPRSAYIHVPFCRHRCGYCNFTVLAGRDDLIEDYLRAIEIELSSISQPHQVDTLFLGGGTPTHLSPRQLSRFFKLIKQWLVPNGESEISIEANPEDINHEIVDVLKQEVTRISLGVQSFRGNKLSVLERGHAEDQVARCIELIRPVVSSWSLDLIFGAPEESLEEWTSDLKTAISLQPDHISTYGLTYEEGTSFFSRRQRKALAPVTENIELAMYETAIDTLGEAGFEHYEVSNFARPNHRCRHNENYWFCKPFFGIGPGASSFVGGRRCSNYRSTTKYLQRVLSGQSPLESSEALNEEDLARERLVFGLRRLQGVNLVEFEQTTGGSAQDLVGNALVMLEEQGLLEIDDPWLRLTRQGLLVSDAIWPYLL